MNDKKIIGLYLSGMSAQKVAQKAGFKSHVSILKVLHRNGVRCRSKSENMMGERRALKHRCDEKFFDSVRTQKQAYLLGLLVSDGNVFVSREQGWRISFSSIDRELVDFAKVFLKATHPIRPTKKGGLEIVVSSRRLVEGLSQYGCGDRKSLTSQWPLLEERLYRHFVRGLFDGDGSVGFDKRGNARWSVACSRDVSLALAEWVEKEIGYVVRPHPHGAIWKVEANGNHRAKRMAEYMYRGARWWLGRKRSRFEAIRTKYVKRASVVQLDSTPVSETGDFRVRVSADAPGRKT